MFIAEKFPLCSLWELIGALNAWSALSTWLPGSKHMGSSRSRLYASAPTTHSWNSFFSLAQSVPTWQTQKEGGRSLHKLS